MSSACPGVSDIFARLDRAARVWAVGAIHGEASRLKALHARLAPRLGRGDRLVYLGGYLGHGPDVAGTLDELIAFLRGSQEEMWQKLLQLQFAPNPREVLQWMLDHGVGATLAAYGADPGQGLAAARSGAVALTRWTASLRAAIDARPGHRQFLTGIKRAAFTEDGGLLFVHAGVDPNKPLDLQRDALWWGGANILEFEQPFGGFHRVVRGYDRRHAGLRESAFAASLDGGSGFGGTLLAACFAPDGALVDSVES